MAWVLAATGLAGCQTWGPTWSELTGAGYHQTISNRRPALIVRVDERGAFSNANPIRVEPGERRLVVQAPAPGWRDGAPIQTMLLAVEPCRRYYINAQFDNPVTRAWTPVVDFIEPIAGCVVPTEKQG
jgi:hypothetical protein